MSCTFRNKTFVASGKTRVTPFQCSFAITKATIIYCNAYNFRVALGPSPDLSSMEELLRGSNISTLASGVVNGNMKVYLFGANSNGVIYMCELLADVAGNGNGTCKVSTIQDPDVSEFAKLIENTLLGGNSGASAPVTSAADDIMSLF